MEIHLARRLPSDGWGVEQTVLATFKLHQLSRRQADLTRQNIEALAKMQESMLSAILPKREKPKDDDEKRS